MKTIKVAETVLCPCCDAEINGAFLDGSSESLNDGDISICMYCKSLLVFSIAGSDVSFSALSPEEFIDLPVELRREIKEMHDYVSKFKPSRK